MEILVEQTKKIVQTRYTELAKAEKPYAKKKDLYWYLKDAIPEVQLQDMHRLIGELQYRGFVKNVENDMIVFC